MSVDWKGVIPAVTTQFKDDYSIDLIGTQKVIEALIEDGVSGLVICGTVGEGCSLTSKEKLLIIEMAVATSGNRVPIIVGDAEYTTQMASDLAKNCQNLGADGIMLLPAMVYTAKPKETISHFTSVAKASDLPIMIYNNPSSYKIDITPEMAAEMANIDTIVAIKESSGDTRRFVDLQNKVGDKLLLYCGLDDVVFECIKLGAIGWISGMSNVFPKEGEALFKYASESNDEKALEIYKWFMPLLHLDARPDLVQCIKLCEQIAGRGTELTRPPRLILEGEDRTYVKTIMSEAFKNRPSL
ncbi:MAG: dihydrodipicolinate synthase family protein [Sphingomonadales bacterium]